MATPMPNNQRLTGPQKAALVLLALDEDVAANILRNFEPADLRRLAQSADSLNPIPLDSVDPAFEEFERRMRDPVLPAGAGAYLRKLTASTLGQEKAQRLFAPPSTTTPPLDALRSARTATLAKLLEEEHPQVAAIIVSQLPREQAAEVVKLLPSERQIDVLGRIAALEEMPDRMVEMASEALLKALAAAGGLAEGDRREFDGVKCVAALLNELPPAETEKLLGTLTETNAKLAPRIREAMFTFEDLVRLNARSVQALMREVASEQLLIALKTASEELRSHFLSAISSRAAAAMLEDLAIMPAMRLSEVEKAQREIVDTAMRLATEGRLVLPGGGGEKLV